MTEPKVINYHNGEKLYNKEKVDELLTTKQDVITPDTTVQDTDNLVENKAVKAYVDAETQRAKSTEGELTDLNTTDKSNLVAAINEVKNSAYTVDKTVTAGSTNPVESSGIKEYVDTHDATTLESAKGYTDNRIGELEPSDGSTVVGLTGHLGDLNNAANSLVSAINNVDNKIKTPDTEMSDTSENAVQNKVIKAYIDDKDTTPTENSEKAVTSDGIYKAIRKANVKIGEIMDWPQFRVERRSMISDNPFEFTFNSQAHSVAIEPKDVELEIADNVPEGWRAMDGSVELDAATNPELAEFFGGRNTTTDGKIWIPYLPRKIIKVAY